MEELLDSLPQGSLAIAAVSGVVTLLIFCYSSWSFDDESALLYTVPVPEQARPEWNSEILANPNIKVGFYSTQYHHMYLHHVLIKNPGGWLVRYSVLLPCKRTIARIRQPCYSRWD
jgi:hypothetical protein